MRLGCGAALRWGGRMRPSYASLPGEKSSIVIKLKEEIAELSDRVMSSAFANNRTRAVVLLSGGMDSCVCAALAARDHQAAAVHISYGQRTEVRERRSFESICDRLEVRDRLIVRNEALGRIGGSALTDSKIAVPEAQGLDSNLSDGVPVTYVPFRNAHFLAVAVSWAEVLGAEKVYIGAVEPDSSGYPDCRPEYYRAFNEVVKAGTKDGTIRVVTPLIAMHKAEIVRLGLELNAPFDLTWSCYQREDRACGVCDSCVLRLRAFREAGAEDPIPYAEAAARRR
jgi:7-cyano-7-deazaguanine synthase